MYVVEALDSLCLPLWGFRVKIYAYYGMTDFFKKEVYKLTYDKEMWMSHECSNGRERGGRNPPGSEGTCTISF